MTDDERGTREAERGPEPVGAREGVQQEVCPCCGLEMSAEALAGLMSQLLPMATPALPEPGPGVTAD